MPTLPPKDSPDDTSPAVAASSHKPPAEPKATRARFSKRGFVQQFDEDRTCSDPSCGTKLSRYNSQRTCAAHGDENRRP